MRNHMLISHICWFLISASFQTPELRLTFAPWVNTYFDHGIDVLAVEANFSVLGSLHLDERSSRQFCQASRYFRLQGVRKLVCFGTLCVGMCVRLSFLVRRLVWHGTLCVGMCVRLLFLVHRLVWHGSACMLIVFSHITHILCCTCTCETLLH